MPKPDRYKLFLETEARCGIAVGLIEKDFWVCWILRHLFSIPEFESRILLKGGTTLSKIYRVIERFSEDIDLAVDYEMLGFNGNRNPMTDMSKQKRTRLLNEMMQVCESYIASEFLSVLQTRIAGILPDTTTWQLSIDVDDGHIVNFNYPQTIDSVGYLRQEVRLELGTHAELIPNDHFKIHPYVAEYYPHVFQNVDCPVQSIKVERTFWEKATILHQEHFRTTDHAAPYRYSRHYYDMFEMAQRDQILQTALSQPDLLKRVVKHKQLFYPRAWARYDLAVPADLQLTPSKDWIDYIKRDYNEMQIMIFGDPPTFDGILEGLRNLESAIRKMED